MKWVTVFGRREQISGNVISSRLKQKKK